MFKSMCLHETLLFWLVCNYDYYLNERFHIHKCRWRLPCDAFCRHSAAEWFCRGSRLWPALTPVCLGVCVDWSRLNLNSLLSPLLACKWGKRYRYNIFRAVSHSWLLEMYSLSFFMLTSCCRMTGRAVCFRWLPSNACWIWGLKHSLMLDQLFPFPQCFCVFSF